MFHKLVLLCALFVCKLGDFTEIYTMRHNKAEIRICGYVFLLSKQNLVSYISCFGDFFCFSILFTFLRTYFTLFLVLPHFLFSTFLAITSPTYTNEGMNSKFFCLYTLYKWYINKNSKSTLHITPWIPANTSLCRILIV